MIKYTTLLESPDSYENLIKLIEKNFNYNDKHSYKEDFSPLMNSTNWENLHLLKDDERVVAHIGARLVKTSGGIPLLFLGGIAVDKDYQGKGYFNKLLKTVIDTYKDEVALMMLWSDLDDLYGKYGFHQAGLLTQTGTEEFSHEKATELGFKRLPLAHLGADKLSQLRRCYEATFSNDFLGVSRGPIDWGVVATTSSADLYVHEERELIDFYFFINKGMDLNNIIHEFAGINILKTSEQLGKLLKFKTWLPSKNPWLEGSSKNSLFMGLFKVGSSKLFSELINIWSNGKIVIVGISDTQILFHFEGQEYDKTHKEFFTLLMGPGRADEFKDFSKELWITGIDSI